jgi:hypothetical protein
MLILLVLTFLISLLSIFFLHFLRLTRLFKGSNVSEENTGVHDSLPQVGGKEIDKVFPARVMVLKGGHNAVAKHHEEAAKTNEVAEHAPTTHDKSREESTDRCCQRGNYKSHASFGSRVEENDLEE